MENPSVSAKEKETTKNLNDPDARKAFKERIRAMKTYFEQIDSLRDGLRETVGDVAGEYGLDKKLVRKLATTMYKSNYDALQVENQMFEELYELVIEGKLRPVEGEGAAE